MCSARCPGRRGSTARTRLPRRGGAASAPRRRRRQRRSRRQRPLRRRVPTGPCRGPQRKGLSRKPGRPWSCRSSPQDGRGLCRRTPTAPAGTTNCRCAGCQRRLASPQWPQAARRRQPTALQQSLRRLLTWAALSRASPPAVSHDRPSRPACRPAHRHREERDAHRAMAKRPAAATHLELDHGRRREVV